MLYILMGIVSERAFELRYAILADDILALF